MLISEWLTSPYAENSRLDQIITYYLEANHARTK